MLSKLLYKILIFSLLISLMINVTSLIIKIYNKNFTIRIRVFQRHLKSPFFQL